MCDTFIIPPSLTESGHRIFAKNSDREPNEAQHWVYMPPAMRDSNRVQTSFISVDHPAATYGMWLSKPFQLWGAEMGINEHGLAIGNEAVFTRVPMEKKDKGLTGMDMIRLALERCRSAKQALEQICYYVEAFGQDACGGYMNRKFYYHNSFIIADPVEAYVLETAGNHWIYRKPAGFYAISNRLTIGKEWDGISKDAISYARERKWHRQGPFDFAEAYTEPVMSWLARARERRQACQVNVQVISSQRKVTVADVMDMLRYHAQADGFRPCNGGMNNVCLHATGLFAPSQTTGSMVAELNPDHAAPVWATSSAAPCLSLFKPFYTGSPCTDKRLFKAPGAMHDDAYWWKWESWHREALQNYPAAKSLWLAKALPLEQQWFSNAQRNHPSNIGKTDPGKLTRDAMDQSLTVLQEMREALRTAGRKRSGWMYRYYWNTWNRKAGIPHSFS
jgi:dipeptidase